MKRNTPSTFLFLALLGLSATLSLVGCTADTTTPPATVSIRLKWLHQTQFAGIYVAEREGYYADENLTVTIDTVDFEQQLAHEKVTSGANDFGIGTPDELILARRAGWNVKAVAVIYRLNPLVYTSPASLNITRPQDLVGKSIALGPGQGTWLYAAMMGRMGIDRSQIQEIETTTFDIYECWETADACVDYAINGPVRVEQDRGEVNIIWPSDYGISFYADVIFTTDEMIAENPDVVARFVRATLNGWSKAIEDPALGTAHTLSFDPALDETAQLDALNASIPLIDTGYVQLGYMEPQVWQEMMDVMVEQGILDQPIDVATVYTNEFVEEDGQ